MSKIAQFVVIIMETATWMEEQAIKFYSHLFESSELGQKYVEENLSLTKLFKIQNDFSVEVLMVYEKEIPSAFMKLNSSRLHNQNLGTNKPLSISEIIYSNAEDIEVLFNRAEVISRQRKYDLIWVKAFETDIILKEKLQSMHYEIFDYEENTEEHFPQKQVYFRKEIQ